MDAKSSKEMFVYLITSSEKWCEMSQFVLSCTVFKDSLEVIATNNVVLWVTWGKRFQLHYEFNGAENWSAKWKYGVEARF